MADIVDRLRAYIHGEHDDYVPDRIREAADEIERLRKGIQAYLDGNFGRVIPRKVDTCKHGLYKWECCENCIDEYFVRLLASDDKTVTDRLFETGGTDACGVRLEKAKEK